MASRHPDQPTSSPEAALIGAGLLALSPGWIGFGRTAVHDIYLSTSITACLLVFWWGFCWPRSRAEQYGYAGLMGLLMGLGFLAKGPLGMLFPGMIIGLYTLFSRDSSRSLIRFSTMAIALGSLAAVITPWLYASTQANGTTFTSHFFGFSNLHASPNPWMVTANRSGFTFPAWLFFPFPGHCT